MHLVSHIKKRQTSRRNGGDRSSPQIEWKCARITLSQKQMGTKYNWEDIFG